MNIQHGFALLGFISILFIVVVGIILGIGWLLTRYDRWVNRHPRLTVSVTLSVVALAIFLIGAFL